MMTNGMPVRTTVMIGPMSPNPNARLQKSAQARFGIARIATTQSLKKALTDFESPMPRPITVPITIAMAMPVASRLNEIPKVSYMFRGASVSAVISSHMNEKTCGRPGQHVDRERPDRGDQLEGQQPDREADEGEGEPAGGRALGGAEHRVLPAPAGGRGPPEGRR